MLMMYVDFSSFSSLTDDLTNLQQREINITTHRRSYVNLHQPIWVSTINLTDDNMKFEKMHVVAKVLPKSLCVCAKTGTVFTNWGVCFKTGVVSAKRCVWLQCTVVCLCLRKSCVRVCVSKPTFLAKNLTFSIFMHTSRFRAIVSGHTYFHKSIKIRKKGGGHFRILQYFSYILGRLEVG